MLEAIRRETQGPDLLMLSADGQIARAVDAMRLGAINYLVKPVDVDQLVAEVRAVMQARRDRATEHDAVDTITVLGHHTRPLPVDAASALDPRPRGSSSDDAGLPRTIGRYQVLSELGSGGMGTIFKCFDPALARTVAVKVVADDSAHGGRDDLLRRFACEAQAAGMLRHPNIVTVYDYSADPEGPVYLAMEYLAGASLAALLASQGKLSWRRTAGIGFQLADALEFAHRNQVIHRDVKPANVFILDGDVAKILDFGIAKLANSELTVPGTFIGSPRYLSPESFRGARIDYRADQFSLGSLMYEMAAGVPAFDFTDFYAGVHHILSEDPRPLEELVPDAPSLLYDIVERLHQKDPDRRYHNEMRLLDDLLELTELAGMTLHLGVTRDMSDYR
jgi:serine/threonine-protein kinase